MYFYCYLSIQVTDTDDYMFKVKGGQTLTKVKKTDWDLFGDFTLKFLGEITREGIWVCSFAAQVLGETVERYVIITRRFIFFARFIK